MVNGFTWSGGPWVMENWTKGQSITLARNDKYWGKKPLLDKVTFNFILDQAAELQAFQTGQVTAMQPQETLQMRQQLQAIPNAKFEINTGTSLEGLWFNARKPPLDSKNVRQAIGYAVDREAIVQQFMRPVMPEAQVLQALAQPDLPTYSPAYEKYKPDQAKVDELMTADGWAKGADGIWAKGGQKISLEISTTAGNTRRELVQQLIQSQLKTAGFELKINNTQAGTLFGEWLPNGRHMIGMYAQVITPHPGFYEIVGSDQIPGPENDNSGQNNQFYGSPAIDTPWKAVDTELDVAKQTELVKQGNAALAEDVPLIPLYLRATIVAYDGSKVGGPIGTNATMGAFWNMNEWGLL
jgi:peptide/nickel transport system substrate-binding protein